MNSISSVFPPLTKCIHYGFASLYKNDVTQQKSLHSAILLHTGDVFASFEAAEVMNRPSRFTVQIEDDQHITLSPDFLQYVNHSCNPNIFFDTNKMELRCLTPISPGEEFTFFYPSTEWEMAEPFHCSCGSNNCLHHIQGACHLPHDAIHKYEFTAYIQKKLGSSHLYIV